MNQQPPWQIQQPQYNQPQWNQQVEPQKQKSFYNQPTQATSHHNVPRILVITLIVGIPTLAVGLFLWFGVLNASCTVGVTGYAANIEFTGLGAGGACSSFINSDSTHYYQYQGEPNGTELCVGNYQIQNYLISGIGSLSVHFVVRDTGLFDLIGITLCKSLLSVGTGAQQ